MTNVISWPVPKEIIKKLWTATLSSENQIFLTLTAYFDPKKYTLKFIAKNEGSHINYFLACENMKKKILKSKIL